MFKDAEKELNRLQEALLEEEDPQPVPADASDDEDDESYGSVSVYKNFSNGYGKSLRNYASGYRPYADADEPEKSPRKSGGGGIRGLVILAVLLASGIAALALWWAVYILKVL